MIKNETEITLKVIGTKDNLKNILLDKGFNNERNFTVDDTYYIKSDINVMTDFRKVLKGSLIVRKISGSIINKTCLIYKQKEFDANGDILKQCAFNINDVNIDETKEFLNALDYKELIRIIEDDELYICDGYNILIKDIREGLLLVEIETNDEYKNIESLISKLNELNLPLDKNDYFVKKVEIMLERKKNENS